MLPTPRRRTVPALTLTATATAAVALLAALPGAAAHAAPSVQAAGTGWSPDLSAVDGDDVNVRHDGKALRLASGRTGPASLRGATAAGQLMLAPRDLAEPVNRVTAQVTGAGPVQVDVRARTGAGAWTEWTPAGTALPAESRRIQARVVLTGAPGRTAPSVSAVRLTGDRIAAKAPRTTAAQTYQVFATREGLVGGTTANGHVITDRDHFVALPSRRGLSGNGSGEYSVQVCTASGSLCEYAPVWDVGPWNTHDDYWNPSATREMWNDLPQGRPESQAAYQDGYNGGTDEFGRQVANPAGIDLADGTFWDGLGLTDNSWVNVTYMWTGAGARGVVRTAGAPVPLRAAASAGSARTGVAANLANVVVQCHVRGQSVTGTYGTSDMWNRIGPGHYVPAAYVHTESDAPAAPAC
ncbi:hypothetical protein [Spirillospora sp. NBC_01491]|uniref:hypothetical protein n=1 Tax=Spirillospora sp. NBC_01491 TaxID=2976007 RepID=UPI002E34F9DF|nr:hypothetical protein [Spirillospora sp. NBC_01491]